MTTFRLVAASEVDVDSPVTDQLLEAVANNPLAIAEQSTGAYINQAVWHPYDSTNVGDANDGEIWSFAADGAQTSIETPTLTSNDYEYGLRFEDVSLAASVSFTVDLYLETTGSWVTLDTTATATGSPFSGFFETSGLRLVSHGWGGVWAPPAYNNNGTVVASGTAIVGHSTGQKISKIRADGGATNFNAGKVSLYRRRQIFGEY